MAYIQCGTVTKTASDGKGFTLRLRLVLYVDRSVSPYRYRVYVDSVRYYASTTLTQRAPIAQDSFSLMQPAPTRSTPGKSIFR